MTERFVRVTVCDTFIWGISNDRFSARFPEFTPCYCRDWALVEAEFGDPILNAPAMLTNDEIATIVEADENNTPDEAWVALAKWKLTQ